MGANDSLQLTLIFLLVMCACCLAWRDFRAGKMIIQKFSYLLATYLSTAVVSLILVIYFSDHSMKCSAIGVIEFVLLTAMTAVVLLPIWITTWLPCGLVGIFIRILIAHTEQSNKQVLLGCGHHGYGNSESLASVPRTNSSLVIRVLEDPGTATMKRMCLIGIAPWIIMLCIYLAGILASGKP
jgi:hypothetical protein